MAMPFTLAAACARPAPRFGLHAIARGDARNTALYERYYFSVGFDRIEAPLDVIPTRLAGIYRL